MSADLHARVDNAIARVTASKAAAEVLAQGEKILISPASFGKIDAIKQGAGAMLEAPPGVASSVRSTGMRHQLNPFLVCKHCRELLPRDAFDDEPRPGGGTSGKYGLCRQCRTKFGRTIQRMPLSIERLDDGAICFSLSRGQFAVVDADDAPAVLKHKWSARRDGHTWYANRAIKLSDGSSSHQFLHQFILGDIDTPAIDHVDGDGLNNRRANLRPATDSQNGHNARKRPGQNRFRGVKRESSGKWRATITIESESIYLGLYESEEDAALAYDDYARAYVGEFARLNLPHRTGSKEVVLRLQQLADLRASEPRKAVPRSDNTSGYRGVSWCAQTHRWRAFITANGRKKAIGSFENAETAARAYDQAAIEFHGEGAKLNFPEEEGSSHG